MGHSRKYEQEVYFNGLSDTNVQNHKQQAVSKIQARDNVIGILMMVAATLLNTTKNLDPKRVTDKLLRLWKEKILYIKHEGLLFGILNHTYPISTVLRNSTVIWFGKPIV